MDVTYSGRPSQTPWDLDTKKSLFINSAYPGFLKYQLPFTTLFPVFLFGKTYLDNEG